MTIDTLAEIDRELDAHPLDVALHRRMVDALRAANDEIGLLAFRVAVETFDDIAAGANCPLAIPLYNLATVLYLRGRPADALRWYQHALGVDPNLAIVHQNLAAVLDALGRNEDAQVHRTRAYTLQRVYVEPAEHAPRRVLVLCAGRATGNTPFDMLLPLGATYRIKYAIDCADEAEDRRLPPFDIVFNAIGEPDVAHVLRPRLERFAAQCGRPVLNRPDRIARTRRHQLPELLAGLDDVAVAPCLLLTQLPASAHALDAALAEAGIALPVLTRPLASHGGEGLTLHTTRESLWHTVEALNGHCYLTAFIDFQSDDRHFRKYRTIFVDRKPYPYHLAIGPHWMVHYVSAGMDVQWKIDEERRFLEDTGAALGARVANALAAIGARLDLDYGGIDYTLLPDGRVLVFEANATMLIHGEPANSPIAHKNTFAQRIVAAFEQLQAERTQARQA